MVIGNFPRATLDADKLYVCACLCVICMCSCLRAHGCGVFMCICVHVHVCRTEDDVGHPQSCSVSLTEPGAH